MTMSKTGDFAPAEPRRAALWRTLCGAGLAATAAAAVIWMVLAPSPLVTLLLIPATLFVYVLALLEGGDDDE